LLRSLRIENLVLIREAALRFAPGLNVITGETGAGKTILAQAIGLLLGAKGDAAYVGPGGADSYVEAEFDLPEGLGEEDAYESLLELQPHDEEGVVLARRIAADGRTRAYAWGRSAAREDVAALGERLLAMSGQFEQRRLARPAYQLAVLDAFCGEEQQRRRAEARIAWRELRAARKRHEELTRGAAAAEARLAELRALVEDTEGMEPGREGALREERERLRHLTELVAGAARAAESLDPEDGEGAAGHTAAAERALAPLERLAPELQKAADELRDAELRLREAATAASTPSQPLTGRSPEQRRASESWRTHCGTRERSPPRRSPRPSPPS
jgi:DNA repair protein RecN (Recombination protein N)